MYLKAGRKKEGKAEMDRLVALGKGHAFAAEVAELGKLLGQ